MTNLLRILPDFDLKPYSHIIPSLEKALISSGDLLTLDPSDVAKRAHVPSGEVKKLLDDLTERLRVENSHRTSDIDIATPNDSPLTRNLSSRKRPHSISTLDPEIDSILGGGIPPRYLTEIVGESAVGKTQFLLTLLLAVQLPPPLGLGKPALYISTEAPLPTTRLAQILESHPRLSTLAQEDKPSLARVHSTHVHDLEAQDHILRYQVPVVVARHGIGLVVIDSIAANYRPEFGKSSSTQGPAKSGGAASFAERSTQLSQVGALLRSLASKHNLAVVVANQVADRFQSPSYSRHGTQISQQFSRPDSPHPTSANNHASHNSVHPPDINPGFIPLLSTTDPLSLDHQQAFTTGWGDAVTTIFSDPNGSSNLKTPSLGLTWTNQLAARVALLKEPIYDDNSKMQLAPGEERTVKAWRRKAKVVFCAWAPGGEAAFEVVKAGVKGVRQKENSGEDVK